MMASVPPEPTSRSMRRSAATSDRGRIHARRRYVLTTPRAERIGVRLSWLPIEEAGNFTCGGWYCRWVCVGTPFESIRTSRFEAAAGRQVVKVGCGALDGGYVAVALAFRWFGKRERLLKNRFYAYAPLWSR